MVTKLFMCDLNWSLDDKPHIHNYPSSAEDFAEIDVDAYYDFHKDVMHNNVAFMQSVMFTGYATYPSKLVPLAPGNGSRIFPRFYERAVKDGMETWSYMNVASDVYMCNVKRHWLIPDSRVHNCFGMLAPETPWTDILCARIREFLSMYPVDVMLFDWFAYGSLKPNDYKIVPAWYMEQPFKEIIGRDLPKTAEEITPEENLNYKREIMARQFEAIYKAVKETSSKTKLGFNVPFHEPREALWEGHPMMEKSEFLLAESSDNVVDWLLDVKKTGQEVMTTVIGRFEDDGLCDPNSWRKWYEKGCGLMGYAWGTPPDWRPHPQYEPQVKIIRDAFAEIDRLEGQKK